MANRNSKAPSFVMRSGAKRRTAKSTPEKRQRWRLAENVIAMEPTLKSCNGYFQEGLEAAKFKVGDVVMDRDGDLIQISHPYGEYMVGAVVRYGYGCKNIEDDGKRVFYTPGDLLTPSGSARHLRLV